LPAPSGYDFTFKTMIKLINDDCIQAMQQMEEGSVDLTVTSPPYDNLRTYEGSLEWNEGIWKQVLEQLYRVTKKGGVVVWVVGDATIKGSETGTSFKQALYAKECGFNLHDTMIWCKDNPVPTQSTRYQNAFEYMFIFSKGSPNTFGKLQAPSKCAGMKNKKHRASGGLGSQSTTEEGNLRGKADKAKEQLVGEIMRLASERAWCRIPPSASPRPCNKLEQRRRHGS
jgi:DNA modification methylase